jgi:hypothetical protein
VRPARLLLAALVVILVTGCAGTKRPAMYWKSEQITGDPYDNAPLMDQKGNVYATVSVGQIRNIESAKARISYAASYYPTLIITEGRDPNAFAMRIEGRFPAVGINVGMLELLARV